jgi:hypothetical protein
MDDMVGNFHQFEGQLLMDQHEALFSLLLGRERNKKCASILFIFDGEVDE